MTIDGPTPPPEANNGKRKHLLLLLALVFVLAGMAWGAYWILFARYHETTDDAYVAGNLIRVTPREQGTVVAVLADDTDHVAHGQVLVRLDAADADIALQRTEAGLADAVRNVRQLFQARDQERANLALKERALEQAKADQLRRDRAVAAQVVSREEAEHAATAREQARLELRLTRAKLASAEASVGGTTLESHPAVKQAEAQLREAWLNRARCEVRAPDDGYVAKRSVQVGQQVDAGSALMAIVPLSQVWVEANFKEDQLRDIRIGQPVTLVSDLYGGGVKFHGKVTGLAAGTGSVFSLLPAQNASGNWIKIVQRLPVRVELDPKELIRRPLRVGLSMKADVDIHDQHGAVLASGTRAGRYVTAVYESADRKVDQLIQRIIDANRGR
ncbi:MAG: efflux RND transporter periplasmic adaptor subunit [Thiobacillaceae bacterium]